MPDSSISILDAAGATVLVDTWYDGAEHRQIVQPRPATTATRSQVVASGTVEQQLLAANTARVGFTLYNSSTANLYLGLGTATTGAADFTHIVAGGGYYESPFGYTGQVRGLWAATNGTAYLTELT